MRDYKHYCDNIENVENYEKAKANDFKGWEVHHRLETHTSDGERRLVDLSYKELIALDMYYHKPPEELIFITELEHNTLHHKGKDTWNKGGHHTEQTKRKISEANSNPSEETRKKMRESHVGQMPWNKGIPRTEEERKTISEALKGRDCPSKGTRWFNNGEICIRTKECPPGFVPGMLR